MTNRPAPDGDWPADGLEAVTACPVCGGTDRRILHAGLRDRVFHTAPGTWTLMRCEDCRSAYLNPRPTAQSIELAYRSYYTHHASAPPPQVGWLRQGLAGDYRLARWGYSRGPRIPGGRLIPRVLPSRGGIVDRDIRHLQAVPEGRLLDVGCGSGAFLTQMAALGWRTEGVDPDPAAVAAARRTGVEARLGTLADLELNEEAFDAITLSHVIEHLHDPAEDLRRLHRLLRPGGQLWIGTPNLEALSFRRFGCHWRGLEPPRHLVLFRRASLERILRRTGFEPLPPPAPSPRAWPMFSQSAAIAQGRRPEEGAAQGKWRVRLLAALADMIARRNPRYADELVVIARRPGRNEVQR